MFFMFFFFFFKKNIILQMQNLKYFPQNVIFQDKL